MVHACGRRLNPFQSARIDDALPIDRNLSMTAKDISLRQRIVNSRLARIDDRSVRRGSLYRFDMPFLYRVAEDNL